MNLTKYIFLLFTVVIFITACDKNDPEPEPSEPTMPPATQEGLNTFGCYIDGELFVAGGADSYWDIPAVTGGFDESEKKLSLQGTRYINNETEESDDIGFFSYVDNGVGTYTFSYNENGLSVGYVNWNGDRCDYYYSESPGIDMGKLTITYLNEEENIISGTFYINLVNEECEGNTIMKITDGRFDFRY